MWWITREAHAGGRRERSQEWHPRQSQHNVNKSSGQASGEEVLVVVGDKGGGFEFVNARSSGQLVLVS